MSRGSIIFDDRIFVPVTKEQKREIQTIATAIGMTQAMFCRTVLFKEVERIKRERKKTAAMSSIS